MKYKDSLHHHILQTRDALDLKKSKTSANSIQQFLNDAESFYTYQEVQQNRDNPNSLWKIINRAIPSKKKKQVYT